MDALFFWIFSFGMIGFGLGVILNRNAVASALCFAFCIVFMAALFVMLSAFFLAAVQILVTAGAVMVLFLFIIMLLDLTAMEHAPRQKIWMACSAVLALGFILIVARTLSATPMGFITENSLPSPQAYILETIPTPNVGPQKAGHRFSVSTEPTAVLNNDDTHQIGRLLFSTYVAPFEITSLLILVATIGVIVLCKQDEPRHSLLEKIDREAPPLEPKKETSLTR